MYGKREVYDKSEIPQTKQSHIKLRYTCKPNKTLPNQRPKSYKKIIITPNPGANCRIKMTGRGAARDLIADPDFLMRESNSPPQGTKRNGSSRTTSAEKKNKPAPRETSAPKRQLWLGFEMMEKLAFEEGAPLSFTPTPIHNLIKNGFLGSEAKEFLKAVHSYPHVNQTCFPLCRPDGIAGQHFNITQLPFEIETNPDTGLSLDYHVAIYFHKPTRHYTHEEILALTQARLKEMKIALGKKIAEPIAILCRNGSIRQWAGTIKLHLKHPGVDGISLLKGTRPFIITLEEVLTVGKICSSQKQLAIS